MLAQRASTDKTHPTANYKHKRREKTERGQISPGDSQHAYYYESLNEMVKRHILFLNITSLRRAVSILKVAEQQTVTNSIRTYN